MTIKELNSTLSKDNVHLSVVHTDNLNEELLNNNTLYNVMRQLNHGKVGFDVGKDGFTQYKAPDKNRENEKYQIEINGYEAGIIIQALMMHHNVLWDIYGEGFMNKLKETVKAVGWAAEEGKLTEEII